MTSINPEVLRKTYDVILIGGAMYGSSIAWFLSQNTDFTGNILVVERDPTYEFCSTSHTNSCIRQQFSQKLNIQLSQFGAMICVLSIIFFPTECVQLLEVLLT